MIYNTRKGKPNKNSYCLDCEFFIAKTEGGRKECSGFGKVCFEADMMGNIVDPITKQTIEENQLKDGE